MEEESIVMETSAPHDSLVCPVIASHVTTLFSTCCANSLFSCWGGPDKEALLPDIEVNVASSLVSYICAKVAA